MKYCSNCGKELSDDSAFCASCGCATEKHTAKSNNEEQKLLLQLSQRLNTNAVIWMVIGILQVLGSIFMNWFLLIVGVLNIISAVSDMKYSKEVLVNQNGIITKFEPLTGPIITLIYNLVIGGVIGVVGSIYYFVGIRNFVIENKVSFEHFDNKQ